MTRFGEALLLRLNKFFPHPHQELLNAKMNPTTYKNFFASRSISSFSEFDSFDISQKKVLDIGCGLGANLKHLIETGAHHVIGLEISPQQLYKTYSIYSEGHSDILNQISFVVGDACQMPFETNSFDALIATDTFEHIENLSDAMQECSRILKPGGNLYAYFPPFYAPWGAHMVNWLQLPWCQVFFSEKTILNVARQLEKNGTAINGSLPLETRLDLGAGEQIPFVNHITVSKFIQIVKETSSFKVQQMSLLPPNWRTNNWAYKQVMYLNKIPVVREMFTAKAFFILQKKL